MKRSFAYVVAALSLSGMLGSPAAASSGHSACRRAAGAGEQTVGVTFAGTEYPVTVYVPVGVRPGTRLPAILNLHGTQSNGSNQLHYSDMAAAADAGRFLVVAPSGNIPAAGGFAWNVPGVGTPPAGARDDVGFLSEVIATAVRSLCADPARVYGTGYSGGGRMISAFACHRADRIAAIAPVAGLRAGRPDPLDKTRPDPASCQPVQPVPVLTFHGQQDHTNPYQGGGSEYWSYPVPVAQQRWAQLDGCRGAARTVAVSTHVTRTSYRKCRSGSEVTLYTVADGGHTWPGTPIDNGNGMVTQEINANTLMWQFFRRHRLRSF
ncbi:polyhydroxybutyrate depolymerase [Actinoplanes sp. SE50]|uniref:extracellular catalytic domain type 1 short-chain-length polyhydroxyalkanoate depolymerase n=1 Tax=unclassified Actinoplanes TaxID=2626549 RepID=UPI00023EC993|nr:MULTISPECIES: polyhydroxybutyrate depolymerase [unclassified Actinoplanes]AEV84773.1 polyhydroxybutyrate depolymerase [Actinoplanes sp. SE50/110]ATO83165.1 polyhydroxybutyrate depolymerase [Actinoplanes sp. SE50]SLM00572.1 feruloyl esterase [Actinoplanes sp. SE50/110]